MMWSDRWHWILHLLPCFAWAVAKLADMTEQLGKIVEHKTRSGSTKPNNLTIWTTLKTLILPTHTVYPSSEAFHTRNSGYLESVRTYLQYPAGEPRVVLIVLSPEEVAHAKVLDEERRHLRRQLKTRRHPIITRRVQRENRNITMGSL